MNTHNPAQSADLLPAAARVQPDGPLSGEVKRAGADTTTPAERVVQVQDGRIRYEVGLDRSGRPLFVRANWPQRSRWPHMPSSHVRSRVIWAGGTSMGQSARAAILAAGGDVPPLRHIQLRREIAGSVAERLAAKVVVDEESGCHNWNGANNRGYGRMRVKGGGIESAHRVAYVLAKGPIPEGLHIDHLCRNPRCCNPEHLEAVTPGENNRRGFSVCAINLRKTHCKRGHPLSPENTYVDPRGSRRCKACRRTG